MPRKIGFGLGAAGFLGEEQENILVHAVQECATRPKTPESQTPRPMKDRERHLVKVVRAWQDPELAARMVVVQTYAAICVLPWFGIWRLSSRFWGLDLGFGARI